MRLALLIIYFNINAKHEEIQDFFSKLIEPLATNEAMEEMLLKMKKEIVAEFNEKINKQNETITLLKSKIDAQNIVIDQLRIDIDNNQSYGRRSCLRIHGVEITPDETPVQLSNKVESCYNECNITFNEDDLDRYHRIGPKYERDGKKYQSIIIKFK